MFKNYLTTKIKLLRKALHILLRIKHPTDKYVVKCSQHLDKLIVEYQKNFVKHKKKVSSTRKAA